MQVKTEIEGKFKDVSILNVTPENFIVPKGEEHLYHCRIEIKKFDPESGERLSKPRMQVFGKKIFETFGLHNLRKHGYTVDIMHDPNEWIKEAKEKAAKMAEEKAIEAKAAEREQIKQEIIEELKMAGIIPASTETAATETTSETKRGRKKALTETTSETENQDITE